MKNIWKKAAEMIILDGIVAKSVLGQAPLIGLIPTVHMAFSECPS